MENSRLALDAHEEIPALIETLLAAEQRLEELTAGEVDTVAGRNGSTFLLQRAQEHLRHSEATKQASILNALPAHIALLDTQGTVVSVNEAWRRFAVANMLRAPEHGVGFNYLTICDRARGAFSSEAHQVADGIRSVLDGEQKSFSIEYPCHSPTEQRWFLLTVTPLSSDTPNGAVVMHLNITESKLAAAALDELTQKTDQRERMLTKMLSNFHDFAYIYDRAGRFLFANQPLLDLWGLTLDAVVGKNFHELDYPDDLARHLQQQLQDVFQTGKSVTGETPYSSPAGVEGFYEYVFSPAFAENGTVEFVVGTTRDVTRRKRNEEALRISEAEFRALAEAMPQMVWITRSDGWNIYFSQQWMDYTGLTLEESLGHGWNKPIHPEDQQRARDAWQQATATRGTYSLECRLRRADGAYRWWLIRGVPQQDSTGNIIKWFGTCTDIHDLKLAELDISCANLSLIESEERYRELVENAIDIIYTLDRDGNYTSVNKASEMILGYSRQESLSRNIIQTVAPELREKAAQLHAAQLSGNNISSLEVEVIAKDGHRVILEVHTRTINEKGLVVGVQGIARDITDRKRLEEIESQLHQSQKLESVGMLAGGIAHDFNNLLTVILGYSALSLRRLDKADPLARNIEEIEKAAERAASLTRQLLAFSRKQVLQPKVLDLNSVIANVEKMLGRLIGENMELRAVPCIGLRHVKADPGQIEQVIINLVVNARDAMPKGGKITIETANIYLDEEYARQHIAIQPGWYAMLAVTDTGEGMDAKIQKSIFEPFFTTKEQGKGTGLGLSTVYGIVKQSGGNIFVYSEVGVGTAFKIYLPLVDEQVSELEANTSRLEGVSNIGTILLAEDEEMVRNLAHESLAMQGYTVLDAANAGEALLICQQHEGPIHLLLTDVVMPRMSGQELATRLVKLRPDMSVLYMSGYPDQSIVHHGTIDGAIAFIGKPFTPDALVLKVVEVLKQHVSISQLLEKK